MATEAGCATDRDVLHAVMTVYASCQLPAEAQRVFEQQIPSAQRDTVSYNALLAAYASDAVWCARVPAVLDAMERAAVRPDRVTVLALLKCAATGANAALIDRARALAQRVGCEHDTEVVTALMYAYDKTAQLAQAEQLFRTLQTPPNDVVYTCLLSAYAARGLGQPALTLVQQGRAAGLSLTVPLAVVTLQALSHALMPQELRDF